MTLRLRTVCSELNFYVHLWTLLPSKNLLFRQILVLDLCKHRLSRGPRFWCELALQELYPVVSTQAWQNKTCANFSPNIKDEYTA